MKKLLLTKGKSLLLIIKVIIGVLSLFSITVLGNEKRAEYSPPVNQRYPSNVYWGDTHLHTNLSVDAHSMGNKSLSPDAAYRFAKGETIVGGNNIPAKLRRPLDFLVVADHANNMGVMRLPELGSQALLDSAIGQTWSALIKNLREDTGFEVGSDIMLNYAFIDSKTIRDKAFISSIWKTVIDSAEQHNHPGQFTAFIGYEWTPLEMDKWTEIYGEPSFTLHHRVVLFRDGKEKTSQIIPFSRFDSENPADLWQYLSDYEEKTGGRVIAIPHNGNLSRGQMFSIRNFEGAPIDAAYAETRSKWEPIVEVTQIKGDSETHPVLSPDDEFADYETFQRPIYQLPEKVGRQYEYARSALKLGLQQQAKLGVNPFKFGMVGGTDAHTSLATADENNFWGKFTANEPVLFDGKNSGRHLTSEIQPMGYSAAGYTAVWAEENTREALFAAMERKEVYASTGPRINVRFFGGWDFKANDAFEPDLAAIGYKNGVPMGGDLTLAPKGKKPTFLIRATKDPEGANLDRVQVIKGWVDAEGHLHEKIYNVSLSGGRDDKGTHTEKVGSTVNTQDASYSNTIGTPELAVVWKDPDFNHHERAFYYARVLEIPTPRWPAYDAKFFNLSDLPKALSPVTQERIYTSPIWYSPKQEIEE